MIFLVHAHSGGYLGLINDLRLNPAAHLIIVSLPLLHETMTLCIGVHSLIAMFDAVVFTTMWGFLLHLESFVFACCISMASIPKLLKPYLFIIIEVQIIIELFFEIWNQPPIRVSLLFLFLDYHWGISRYWALEPWVSALRSVSLKGGVIHGSDDWTMVLHKPVNLLLKGHIETVVGIDVILLPHLRHHRKLKVLLLRIIHIHVTRTWYLIEPCRPPATLAEFPHLRFRLFLESIHCQD